MSLTIPPELVPAMQDHALACYPGECCGLLFGSEATARRWIAVENMADRLHALDPVEYPRTSRDAFMMNEARVARLVREAEAAGEQWLAIVHSHIDCGAYFSAEDHRVAAPDGIPVYPRLWQVVIDCQPAGRIVEAKAFRWDGRTYAHVATYPHFAREPR
ncbi:MAG: Mov34/MPN/PAD-1 family protein [Planctomycetes bacterium]|nr:Mov34/MPN/PAD-1 family protein [Planctomycetota bacterium]